MLGKGVSESINLRRWAIIGLGLILTVALVILVWNKEPTIYPYLFVAIALASLIAFSIVGYYKGVVDKFSTICLILIVFLLLRNVQFISTHYSALMPAGDVHWEYAVINTFAQDGQISVIPPGEFSRMLTWYSSWPALHTFSLAFADVTGVGLHTLPIVLPIIFSCIGFFFVYLLANGLAASLKLSNLVVPLALLLYAVSPEAIYYGFKFVRQGMGTVLVLAMFYLIYKYLTNRDPKVLALVILNALLLVAVHHYTSFIFAGYLLAFAGITFVLALLISRLVKTGWMANLAKLRSQVIVVGLVALVMSGAIFAWWSNVGTIIHGVATGVTSRAVDIGVQVITEVAPPAEITPFFPKWHYPAELTPPWVSLLWARDFLIYGPVFFGFAWLLWKRLKNKSTASREAIGFYLVVITLSCFGAFFLFELFISHVEPYRVVLLSLPFITLCGAILYVEMLSRRRWLLYLCCSLLVFAVTMSFLGLWGHRHAPVHLYSTTISHYEVGEATPLDDRHYALREFVAGNELDHKAEVIVSDSNDLLYLLLSPEQYHKFGLSGGQLVSGLNEKIATGDSLLVVDFDTSLYHYYSGEVGPEAAQERREQYRSVLEGNLNKVYDNTFEVWLE